MLKIKKANKNIKSCAIASLILVSTTFNTTNAQDTGANCTHPTEHSITKESSIDEIRAELNQMSLPILDFRLADGRFPSFEVMEHPAGCVGTSIINNEYVEGSFVITIKGDTIYNSGEYEAKKSGVRLRNRGNTSTAGENSPKKGYKIKLSKKANLLSWANLGSKDKDWVLKGASRDLKQITGAHIAKICGSDWQPDSEYVALIINDTYMGCYCLTESVTASESRVNISDSGFIIENDPYWWKPGEAYFKSNYLPYYVGYTFKEPDPEDVDESVLENIKNYINDFERKLYSGEDITDDIDLDSFASWLLAHDILATIDAGGSNIFVQKYDLIPDNPSNSKIKMGPLWDFDDTLTPNYDDFAKIHNHNVFWFPVITTLPQFNNLYLEKWMDVRESLNEDVSSFLSEFEQSHPDLCKIRLIDKELELVSRGGISCPSEDVDCVADFLNKRIQIIDSLTEKFMVNINNIPETNSESIEVYDICGNRLNSADGPGIKILRQGSKTSKIMRTK